MNKNKIILTVLALVCFVLIVFQYLIRTGNLLLAPLVLSPFVVISVLNKPKLLLKVTFALIFSNLTLFFFPGGLMFFHFFAAMFVGVSILAFFMHEKRREDHNASKYIFSFLLVIGLVMLIRGAGFRVLGDGNWGGFRYVHLILSLMFLMNTGFINLSEKETTRLFHIMFGLSVIPSFAEILFILSGSQLYQLYYFVNIRQQTIGATFDFLEGTELVRFHSGSYTGGFLVVLSSLLILQNKKRLVAGVFVMILGIILILISGHRGVMITSILFLWIFGLFTKKVSFLNYIYLSLGASFVLLVAIYVTAPYFPPNIQRTISFLPGVNVTESVRVSGHNTINWRLNLWREALVGWKENVVIGRGFTYPGRELEVLAITPGEYSYWWAVISMVYHNGPLSLFLGLGAPGFLLGSFILIYFAHRNIDFLFHHKWKSKNLYKIHLVLTAYVCSLVFYFYFIYGEAYSSMPRMFYLYAFLEIVIRSEKAISDCNEVKSKGSNDELEIAGDSFGFTVI